MCVKQLVKQHLCLCLPQSLVAPYTILSGENVLPAVFIKIEGCKKTFEYHNLCKKVVPLLLLMSDNFLQTLSIIETSAFYLHFGWVLLFHCLESQKEMFSAFASAPPV